MPRAAPAGAHPAARLNFFVARGVGRMDEKNSKRSPDRGVLADRQGWGKFTTGRATRIRDGLVSRYRGDAKGWPVREGAKSLPRAGAV
jgi:hypothetical protein